VILLVKFIHFNNYFVDFFQFPINFFHKFLVQHHRNSFS
jgi:hypothetical protein